MTGHNVIVMGTSAGGLKALRAVVSKLPEQLEAALWSAIRIMEEKVTLSRQLALRKRSQNLLTEASAYEQEAEAIDKKVTMIRDLIVIGLANQTPEAELSAT